MWCVWGGGGGIRDKDKETKSPHRQNSRAIRMNSCSEGDLAGGEVYGSGGGEKS